MITQYSFKIKHKIRIMWLCLQCMLKKTIIFLLKNVFPQTEILECMYVVSLTAGRNKNKLWILRRSKLFGHFWWSIFYLVLDGKGVYYKFNKAYVILMANHGFLGGTDSFFIIIAMRIWEQMYVHHWQLQMPNY